MPAPLTIVPPEPLPGDRVVITAPAEPPADAQLTVRWQLPHGIPTEATVPARGTQWELAQLLPDLCAAGCPGGDWTVSIDGGAIDGGDGPWAQATFRIAVPIEPAAPGELVIEAELGRRSVSAALRNASSRAIWIPAGDDLVVSCTTETASGLGASIGSVGASRVLPEATGVVLEPGSALELGVDPGPGPVRRIRSLTITVEPAGQYAPVGATAPRVYLRDPVTATVER